MSSLYLILLLIFSVNSLKSAEITSIWHTESGAGDIQDMEILKGHKEILLLVGVGPEAQFQLRSTESGELINSAPISTSIDSRIAMTPDSNRFIHLNAGVAQIRTLDKNYSMIGYFGVDSDSINYRFTNIAIDPIRPLAYVTIYGWTGIYPNITTKSKVSIYNYETGEYVQDLTELGDFEYSVIEVSNDGRFLATLNDGKTYLKVWDLETLELIVNEKLFDDSEDIWCVSIDIKYSINKINMVYISGLFSKQIDSKRHNGVFAFDLLNSKRTRIVPDGLYDGNQFQLLDNETRIFNSSRTRIGVLNLNNSQLEWYGVPPEYVFSSKVIYSEVNNYFIGFANKGISKFIYDSQADIISDYKEEIVVSPNPTSSTISINQQCNDSQIDYSIYNSMGNQIIQETVPNTNTLQINMIDYASGVYFLVVNCGNELKSYKIIRE